MKTLKSSIEEDIAKWEKQKRDLDRGLVNKMFSKGVPKKTLDRMFNGGP